MKSSVYAMNRPTIEAFYVQRMGTYDTPYRRPLVSQFDENSISNLQERFQQQSKINPQDLVTPTKQLLTPSDQATNPINIIHGWETPRRRFMLRIRVSDKLGYEHIYTYVGYTEHADDSFSGHLDANAVFFIGSRTGTKLVNNMNQATGQKWQTGIQVYSQQLLHDHEFKSVNDSSHNYSLAPHKVFNDMCNHSLAAVLDGPNDMLKDSTVMITNRGHAVNRSDTLSGQYGSNILNTLITSLKNSDSYENDSSEEAILQGAARQISTNITDQFDPLMDMLDTHRHTSTFSFEPKMFGNSFTLSELAKVFGTTVDMLGIRKLETHTEGLYQKGLGQGLGSATPMARIATQVSTALPAYMSSLNLSEVKFKSTNRAGMTSEMLTIFAMAKSPMSPGSEGQLAEALKARLHSELYPLLTFAGHMLFEIEVYCDCYGEIWIEVAVDGIQGSEMFVFPAFADSLFSPLTAPDQNFLHDMSISMRSVGTTLANTNSVVKSGSNVFGSGIEMMNQAKPSSFGNATQPSNNIFTGSSGYQV
jgi:hypothetical protein